MFPIPQMFGTNIRLDLLKIDILGFIHIPETTAVFMYFFILNPPQMGGQEYQDRMKNVGLYTQRQVGSIPPISNFIPFPSHQEV